MKGVFKIMKKAIAVLLAASLTMLCACSSLGQESGNDGAVSDTAVTDAEVISDVTDTNLIKNGDFSMNTASWNVYLGGGFAGSPSVESEQLHLGLTSVGNVEYGVQLFQDIIPLYKGGVYRCTFDMRSDVPRRFEFRMQQNGGDYKAYTQQWISLSDTMETYTIEFTMEEESDEYSRIVFNLGNPMDGQELGVHHIYLDNVKLELIDDSAMQTVEQIIAPDISVDQIGYLPEEKKIAIFRGEDIGTEFSVVDAVSGETVFDGKITGSVENTAADETNSYGDFTSLTTAGTYFIQTDNNKSYTFQIGDGVYGSISADTIRMLYLQRCGSELTPELAGDFAHPACHAQMATVYETGEKIDVSGGWHDAGDYGKYVVAGAKTVADLLIAYDRNPEFFDDAIGIPESYNGTPDVLDEARYELEWLLKMQSSNGGVYHKATTMIFPGDVLPQNDTADIYVTPVSTTATADFAAVMAMASKTYRDTDSAFADECLAASKKAYAFLEQNEFLIYKNINEITTGAYSDSKDADERYWAAAALYSVTGEEKYRAAIEKYSTKDFELSLGWQEISAYGSYCYLTSSYALTDSSNLPTTIREKFIAKADEICSMSKTDGYFISLGEDYPWGSNMTVANAAMYLILANDVTPKTEYIDTARDHLHYLCGRNPMAICYVTGSGTVSPISTHHRPSTVIGKSMPGMLVGGPDGALEDDFVKLTLRGMPPAKCYADNKASYSTNEITIYWNSPLIFVFSELG